MQDSHPVAYESRKLTGSQLRWPTHEKKLYAVVHCLKSWRHYVNGRKTKVFTDNISLKYLDTKAQATPKYSTQPKIGKLRPLPIPKQNFYSTSMDFMTGVPKVAGYDAIMVIVCRLSKWLAFVPCSKQATAEEVAQLFLDNWVRHKGYPWEIMSDRGLLFQIQFWQHMMRRMGVRLSMTTAWYLQRRWPNQEDQLDLQYVYKSILRKRSTRVAHIDTIVL